MKLKYLFIPMILVFLLVTFAKAPEAGQQSASSPEEEKVQALVETFFEGFHKQDSMLIKKVVHENVLMQSIGKNQIGEIVLSKEDFSGFLSSICSIPETTSFEERIHDYKIQMDGKMANVWTPYSF